MPAVTLRKHIRVRNSARSVWPKPSCRTIFLARIATSVRGLHYDARMVKLVRCIVGKIYDVIVDLREGSKTYLHWEAYELSEENHRQIFVSRGFAHGFLSLSESVVGFKQSVYHDPACERGVAWDDPAIGIDWPLSGEPIVSGKDKAWPRIRDARPAG